MLTTTQLIECWKICLYQCQARQEARLTSVGLNSDKQKKGHSIDVIHPHRKMESELHLSQVVQ